MELTDEPWRVLGPLIGQLPRRADGRGRPWRSSREVLNGIVWIWRTAAQWHDLPERYPPYQTGHASAAASAGSVRAHWNACSKPSPRTSRSAASSISQRVAATARSSWRNRGRVRGSDQAGQRDEADG